MSFTSFAKFDKSILNGTLPFKELMKWQDKLKQVGNFLPVILLLLAIAIVLIMIVVDL